jgi:hypothetical protein
MRKLILKKAFKYFLLISLLLFVSLYLSYGLYFKHYFESEARKSSCVVLELVLENGNEESDFFHKEYRILYEKNSLFKYYGYQGIKFLVSSQRDFKIDLDNKIIYSVKINKIYLQKYRKSSDKISFLLSLKMSEFGSRDKRNKYVITNKGIYIKYYEKYNHFNEVFIINSCNFNINCNKKNSDEFVNLFCKKVDKYTSIQRGKCDKYYKYFNKEKKNCESYRKYLNSLKRCILRKYKKGATIKDIAEDSKIPLNVKKYLDKKGISYVEHLDK